MSLELNLSFRDELTFLINKHSMENASDTPDFILANYISSCLDLYASTVRSRDKWFGIDSPWDKKKD